MAVCHRARSRLLRMIAPEAVRPEDICQEFYALSWPGIDPATALAATLERSSHFPVQIGWGAYLLSSALEDYGANGAGKSSFTDALEYILADGRIGHLSHEYSGSRQQRGLRNTHAPPELPSTICIRFQGGTWLQVTIQPARDYLHALEVGQETLECPACGREIEASQYAAHVQGELQELNSGAFCSKCGHPRPPAPADRANSAAQAVPGGRFQHLGEPACTERAERDAGPSGGA